MSVANLEAFALTQGIDKAFSEMTQGEQVMLRYQYLMQATADAQGDFARTSDGYANAVRTLQTNIDSLKTSVGTVLLPIVSEVVAGINDMITSLTKTTPTTVLDDFAAIDLETDAKLAEIQATADKAYDLIGVLDDIQTDVDELNKSSISVSNWSDVLGLLDKLGNFKTTDPGKSITDLSAALEGADPNTSRATAWQELLAALSTDIEGLSELTGKSPEETKRWLEEIAASANTLDPNSAEGWDDLLGRLKEGLPGLEDTNLGGTLGVLAGDADNAEGYLRALGYETGDIVDKQKTWLEVCKRLVEIIPGLSSIINTETGEIEGGTDALRTYVDEWKASQEKLAIWKAVFAKKAALDARRQEEREYEAAMLGAKKTRDRLYKELEQYGGYDALSKRVVWDDYAQGYTYIKPANGGLKMSEKDKEALAAFVAYDESLQAVTESENNYNAAVLANKEAVQEYDDMVAGVEETYGELEEAADDAADATAHLTDEQITAINTALSAYRDALDDVYEYAEAVFEDTMKSMDSVADGFGKITTPAEQARNNMEDLTADIEELNKAGKDTSGIVKQRQALEDSIPTIQNMTMGLEDQIQYWKDYLAYMEQARANGVSEDILAFLSDGSVESFDYLTALAKGDGDIEELNSKYAELIALKEEAATELTNTRLGADDEFQSLVSAANAAAEGLDVYPQAESAMESTVQGIVDGLAAKIPEVEAQVAALNKALEGINSPAFRFFNPTFKFDGSLATGLDYVPFNGYLAQLHEGESVLTAEEARVWRDFKNAGASVANTIDYEAMGGVMRDNIRPGGNVYLDGNIVGRVVSDRQGNALRQLERSGWQR